MIHFLLSVSYALNPSAQTRISYVTIKENLQLEPSGSCQVNLAVKPCRPNQVGGKVTVIGHRGRRPGASRLRSLNRFGATHSIACTTRS